MKNVIAMIPAAGRGSRMMSLTENMPKAMLPLHGKPIIGWHLDKLIEENISDVCIIVGYQKDKLINYTERFYSDKINITYVEQKELKGLGHAIKKGLDDLKKIYDLSQYGLLIVLGDTIIRDSMKQSLIDPNISWVGYNEVPDFRRWCLLETTSDNTITEFFDKPNEDPNTRKAVIGIYYFHDIPMMLNCLDRTIQEDIKIKGEYQLSTAMDFYQFINPLKAYKFTEWYDCGEVETFNKSRKNITRHFNSITVTNDNTIIKKSSNNKKIKQEINWFLNIPNKLRVYTPQLIDYSMGENTFYELEYINFTPIQELFLYDLPELCEWKKLFDNIFNCVNKFNLYSVKSRYNVKEHLNDILIDKTKQRLKQLTEQDNEFWSSLLSKDTIMINGKEYKNFNIIKEYLFDYLKDNIIENSNQYWQIIHGDLFFGNMLYDINSDTLKVIDPRGNFGVDGIYGDIRYDLAKLNHSILGKYDFIVNDLYVLLSKENSNFEYIMYDSEKHKEVIEEFNKYLKHYNFNQEHILLLTGLLFLSMIPLHEENKNNQIMFYLKSIEIFNMIF